MMQATITNMDRITYVSRIMPVIEQLDQLIREVERCRGANSDDLTGLAKLKEARTAAFHAAYQFQYRRYS